MEFGQYLRKLRKAKGITLVELGEKAGFKESHLSNIERGLRGVPPETVRKLSVALGVTHIGMMIKAGHITEEEVLTYRKHAGIDDLKGE